MGNNIAVPYSGYITGGVHDGTDVVISGRTTPSFNSFSFNLCSGPNISSSDAALHFNPRFNQGQVVRNHKQGGQWGAEETGGHMPFRRGSSFVVHMKVQSNQFSISVNRRHYCNFQHRLPKEGIQYLYIEGDVTIEFIQFRATPVPHGGGAIQPSYPQPSYPQPSYPQPSYPPAPQPFIPPAYPGYPQPGFPAGNPIYNPPIPLTTPIIGGMYPGKIIYVTGVPYPNCSRFSVNLLCGPSDSHDFALHFDARINYGNDHGVVIRNHKQGPAWGNEEKHQSYFPFVPGQNFEIMVLCEPQCYKIAVNNQHFTEFYHRIQPLNRATHLSLKGDVTITQVRFQ